MTDNTDKHFYLAIRGCSNALSSMRFVTSFLASGVDNMRLNHNIFVLGAFPLPWVAVVVLAADVAELAASPVVTVVVLGATATTSLRARS